MIRDVAAHNVGWVAADQRQKAIHANTRQPTSSTPASPETERRPTGLPPPSRTGRIAPLTRDQRRTGTVACDARRAGWNVEPGGPPSGFAVLKAPAWRPCSAATVIGVGPVDPPYVPVGRRRVGRSGPKGARHPRRHAQPTPRNPASPEIERRPTGCRSPLRTGHIGPLTHNNRPHRGRCEGMRVGQDGTRNPVGRPRGLVVLKAAEWKACSAATVIGVGPVDPPYVWAVGAERRVGRSGPHAKGHPCQYAHHRPARRHRRAPSGGPPGTGHHPTPAASCH